MDRVSILEDVSHQIISLTRLQTPLDPHRAKHFQARKDSITSSIRTHRIDVRNELRPEIFYLYRRYFG